MAPDVFTESYNEKCDEWSCGVIMYLMLCGYPPFNGRTDGEILRKIQNGQFTFRRIYYILYIYIYIIYIYIYI